jgi:hypothetical protein
LAARRERFLFVAISFPPSAVSKSHKQRPIVLHFSAMRIAAAAFLAVLLTSCTAYKAPKHATWKNTTSVEEMERLYWQAIKDKDWINVEAHTASSYTNVAPGAVSNKQQIIEFYKGMNLLEYSLGDFEVVDHAGTTTVTYRSTATFEIQGKHFGPVTYQNMSVWQQQKKGWAMIASSASPIR